MATIVSSTPRSCAIRWLADATADCQPPSTRTTCVGGRSTFPTYCGLTCPTPIDAAADRAFPPVIEQPGCLHPPIAFEWNIRTLDLRLGPTKSSNPNCRVTIHC